MINDDNECLTDSVTIKSKTISSHENNPSMSSTVSLSNNIGEEHSVQNENNNNNDFIENAPQDNQSLVVQPDQNGKEEEEEEEEQQQQQGENDDDFIRITAAHQMLTEAQTYEEQKNFPAALHLYRICVDLLLEELMFAEGTDQSRVYLREKCTAVMDRVDLLKTKLEPIPSTPAAIEPPSSIESPLAIEPNSTIEKETTPPPPPTSEQETAPPPPTKEQTIIANEQATTTTSEEATNPPTEELNSIHLS